MEAMSGNLDHTAELEAPSVRAGRSTPLLVAIRGVRPSQQSVLAAAWHHVKVL